MVIRKSAQRLLVIGALGVVFGDIGTSPLYAFQAVFSPSGRHLPINAGNITGVISLVIWAITLVVSIKFIGFIMRADNQGEGGILALVSLIKGSPRQTKIAGLFVIVGLIGAALFYGDSAITPAISVLSAVEGVRVIAPSVSSLVIPVTLIILTLLFMLQKYGTALIGELFGPVMLLWFGTIAAGGIFQILQHPAILIALSPMTALSFVGQHPMLSFIATGAVVLVITGAEALYADMGQFGRPPIARAWFLIVFPALLLCYLGQGALLIDNPGAAVSPFMLLFPSVTRIPVLLIATVATLIASQSVISGAFSITRQAVQLNFLPKMLIRHTSDVRSGQIYVPLVNSILFLAVIFLVLFFGSSVRLSNAYGVAVSGTLAADTLLYVYVMRNRLRKPIAAVLALGTIFLAVDLSFVASTIPKILTGGWIPVSVALVVFLLIQTWRRGEDIISGERKQLEGSLQAYVDTLQSKMSKIDRVPGQAVYISHHPGYAPLAFHESVEENEELHEKVVIVSVNIANVAHVSSDDRASFDILKYNDGISHLTLNYGYHDAVNIPNNLAALRKLNTDLDFDPKKAAYFISMSKVVRTKRHNLAPWRKVIFTFMQRNALSSSDYFKLPLDRTTEVSSMLKL